MRVLSLSLLLLIGAAMPRAVAEEPLRSIALMRELSQEELARRPTIEVECIALSTLNREDDLAMVVWQEGSSIYVDVRWSEVEAHRILPARRIAPGDRLRIRGKVWEAHIAPSIIPAKIEWLGLGDLPEARQANLVDMLSGRLASQWVQVRAVVQAVKPFPGYDRFWLLYCGTEHGRFALRLRREPDVDPASWIDAEVSIRGLCMQIFNHRRETLGVRMHVNSAADITVIKPSPPDPFAVATSPLGHLQPFTPHERMPHRRKVFGTVTFSRPGSHLYLQDEGLAVKIKTTDATAFQPGDLVEAAGFVVRGTYVSEIHHAVLRRIGTSEPPAPLHVSTNWPKLLRMPHESKPFQDIHGRLIEITGVLELDGEDLDGRWISVASDGASVQVRLSEGMSDFPLRGSMVKLTGICELVQPVSDVIEHFMRPTGIVLLLRGSEDLTVIEPASWWTPQRLWIVVGCVGAFLVLALLWVNILSRKVQQRGMALASEMSGRQLAEARTEERTRIAEDLHDTLAQGLTGVSLHLEAADRAARERPADLPRYLKLASQILNFSRSEIRRTLWNLRTGLLDTGDMIGSLQAIATNLSPDSKPEIACCCAGAPHPLPDSIAHTLLRCGQEAMSNAVNHASAQRVEAILEFGEGEVSLIVRDDGNGFLVDDVEGSATSHFGLQGMRERIGRMNGRFQIETKPGGGTTVRAVIPYAARVIIT
jgi:signal transduction histidine kinase